MSSNSHLLALNVRAWTVETGSGKSLQVPRSKRIHFTTHVLLRLRGLHSHQACWCPSGAFPRPPVDAKTLHLASWSCYSCARRGFSSSILTTASPSSNTFCHSTTVRVAICDVRAPSSLSMRTQSNCTSSQQSSQTPSNESGYTLVMSFIFGHLRHHQTR